MRVLALVVGLALGCTTSGEATKAARDALRPLGVVEAVACESGCDHPDPDAWCMAVVKTTDGRQLQVRLQCNDDECEIHRITPVGMAERG